MGFAVARAAVRAGHRAILVSGPTALATPKGAERVDVVSARDMLAAVRNALGDLSEPTALVMAAAVADWRPATCHRHKQKKSQMGGELKLVRNPDVLKTLARSRRFASRAGFVKIGFAAETGDPATEAARKCREKDLALVVANDVTAPGAGFGTDTNRVAFVTVDGAVRRLPLMSKDAVARRIVRFAAELAERDVHAPGKRKIAAPDKVSRRRRCRPAEAQ